MDFGKIAKEYGLYRLSESDIGKAIDCNVDAYFDYPLYYYLYGKHYDTATMRRFWRISIKTIWKEALFLEDGPDVRGSAIFLPPGFSGTKAMPFIMAGGLTLPPSMYRPMLLYESYAMSLKERYTSHDSWYLYNIAVRRRDQRQDVASSMMRPMLSFFSDTDNSCYLETHDRSNVAMYEHFGFKLVETGKVPGTDINHYAMLYE